jgi:hypothetical protein
MPGAAEIPAIEAIFTDRAAAGTDAGGHGIPRPVEAAITVISKIFAIAGVLGLEVGRS